MEEEKNEYGVALKHNVLAKSGISERLLNEYLTRDLGQKVISIKDYLIIDAGSHNSRAVALLSIHGEPQGVSLDYLLSRAGRLRVHENSIRTYATSDGLELIDGQVRRYEPDLDTPIGGSIANSQNVYFRQGQWHLLLTLTKDHVRGSGFHIPRGIGNHYGLNFGDGIDLTSPLGSVRMGTDKLRTLRLSSIGRFIQGLGAGIGDRVWLTFGDDRSFAVSLAPKLQPELTGFAGLYNHIGLDITEPELDSLLQQEANDADTSRADLLAPINEALGLSPDAPRRRTVSLLRQRNQDELAEAISKL